jgi:hypothetical protein
MSQRAGLDLEAVQWEQPAALIVPCVVYWKDHHYAAIVAERNGLYQVVDPILKKPRWLELADVLDEASGAFLIPKQQLPTGWKAMEPGQAEEIYGRGNSVPTVYAYDSCGNSTGASGADDSGPLNPAGILVGAKGGAACPGDCSAGSAGGSTGGGDSPSCSCSAGPSGNGGKGGNAAGGNGSPAGPPILGASSSSGMPIWRVSEPSINLWLDDEPLGYQPGLGPRISFRLSYKQPESTNDITPSHAPFSTNVFSLGPFWNCSWLSYIADDSQNSRATMCLPGGGERDYVPNGTNNEYFSNTRLQRNFTNGQLAGFVLTYANGAQDLYQFVPTNSLIHTNAFLTARLDSFGHGTRFYYQQTNYSVKLLYVVDADGQTNTLSYTNTLVPTQITGVTDPFGNSVTLQYDTSNTNGWLTNVVDPVGLGSSFAYDSGGNITNLCTPYGKTTFETFDNSIVTTSFIRAIRVLDASGATNVYMFGQMDTLQYLSPLQQLLEGRLFRDREGFPSTIPSLICDETKLASRDSFHWGPRQAATLPIDLTTLVTSGCGTEWVVMGGGMGQKGKGGPCGAAL